MTVATDPFDDTKAQKVMMQMFSSSPGRERKHEQMLLNSACARAKHSLDVPWLEKGPVLEMHIQHEYHRPLQHGAWGLTCSCSWGLQRVLMSAVIWPCFADLGQLVQS